VSWDAHILRLDRLVSSLAELPNDYTPPAVGSAVHVRASITEAFPTTDWADPSWGVLDCGEYALEFSLGSDDPIPSFSVHVRGDGDPIRPLVAMCTSNGWRVIDVQTTELLDPQDPSTDSWARFREYRDRVTKR
jgi:hypothetical protein